MNNGVVHSLLLALPRELCLSVAGFLDWKSFLTLGAVCKALLSIANDDLSWSLRCRSLFSTALKFRRHQSFGWRTIFQVLTQQGPISMPFNSLDDPTSPVIVLCDNLTVKKRKRDYSCTRASNSYYSCLEASTAITVLLSFDE